MENSWLLRVGEVVAVLLLAALCIGSGFVAQVLAAIAITLLVCRAVWKSERVAWATTLVTIAMLLALLVPLDIAIRNGERLGLAVLPVQYFHHNSQTRYVAEHPTAEFLAYRGAPIVHIKWALVLTVPVTKRIVTPLFMDPHTPLFISAPSDEP